MKASPKIGALATVAAILVLLILLGTSGRLSTGYAHDTPGQRTAELQQIVRGLVADGAPGALVVVRTPTGIRRAASGFASLKPTARLRPTDRFRIASVTKTFVATLALQLVAQQGLSLDDTVERWLPGTAPNGGSITIRELLNHTSGLFDYDDDQAWVSARISDPGREWSPRELIAIATSHPPLFPPGEGWSYSNTNYVLVGLVIEAATHKSLADNLQVRVFKPLGLRSTSYPSGTTIGDRFAHGYLVSRPPLRFPAGTLIDVSTLVSPSGWGAGQIVLQRRRPDTFLRSAPRRATPSRRSTPGDEERTRSPPVRTRTAHRKHDLRQGVRPRRRLSWLPQHRLGNCEWPAGRL